MKKIVSNSLTIILFVFFSLTSALSFSSPVDIEPNYDWKQYLEINGVTVEYKFEKCEDGQNNNEVWVVFRFTNTSSAQKELKWTPKWYRGGQCVNCHMINDNEFSHSLTLSPGESLKGEACVNQDNRFYMFSHFVTLYPGMSAEQLTDFEFINVEVK